MILLFSGGVDSFIAYHYLGHPRTLYFDLSTPYTNKEIRTIVRLIPATTVDYSLSGIGKWQSGPKAYLPFRNLLMAAVAANYDDQIVIAGIKDDMVSDKNEQIFKKFSSLLSELEGRKIRVISPFWKMTKSDIVRWYLESGGDLDALLSTTSCYSKDDDNYCGRCPSCFRKWVAFRSAGIDIDFYNKQMMKEYYQAALVGKYIHERNQSIVREIDAYSS